MKRTHIWNEPTHETNPDMKNHDNNIGQKGECDDDKKLYDYWKSDVGIPHSRQSNFTVTWQN